jgi:hypothetical protein
MAIYELISFNYIDSIGAGMLPNFAPVAGTAEVGDLVVAVASCNAGYVNFTDVTQFWIVGDNWYGSAANTLCHGIHVVQSEDFTPDVSYDIDWPFTPDAPPNTADDCTIQIAVFLFRGSEPLIPDQSLSDFGLAVQDSEFPSGDSWVVTQGFDPPTRSGQILVWADYCVNATFEADPDIFHGYPQPTTFSDPALDTEPGIVFAVETDIAGFQASWAVRPAESPIVLDLADTTATLFDYTPSGFSPPVLGRAVFCIDPTLAPLLAPPLRQRQRDDRARVGRAARNAPSSKQRSIRRGGNTYA